MQIDSIKVTSGRDGALYGVASYGLAGYGSQSWTYTGWLFRVNTDGTGLQTLSNQVKNFTGAPVQLADGRICGFTAGSNPMAPTADGGLYVSSPDGSAFDIHYRELALTTNSVLFQNGSDALCGVIGGKLYQLAPDGSGYSALFTPVMEVDFQGAGGKLYGRVSVTPISTQNSLVQWPSADTVARMNGDGSGFTPLCTFIYQSVYSGTSLGSFILGRDGSIYGTATDVATGNGLVFSLAVPAPTATAPAFTVNPSSVTIASGHSAAFNAAANGGPPPNYQWYLNGVAIPGADDPILLVGNSTGAGAGSYTCVATNMAGSVTSSAATLTVDSSGTPGFLLNISARGDVGPTAGNTSPGILFGGFALSGDGVKHMMFRGLGPGMAYAFPSVISTSQVVADPQLALYDSLSTQLGSNSGWNVGGVPSSTMQALGAYAIQPGSHDCALETGMIPGDYTVLVSTNDTGALAGVGSVEIYDADQGFRTVKITNLSARDYVGSGVHLLIGGIVIGGTDADTILIRAVGPGLADTFNLASTLAQPGLMILDSSGAVIYNCPGGWGGDRTIADVSAKVGAFSLVATHADEVALLSLAPGSYTALVNGLSGSTGQALIEFYEVP